MESEKEGLETGADVYLVKPFQLDLLRLRIKNLLQTKSKLYNQFRYELDAIVFKKASETKDQELLARLTEVIKQNLDNSNLDIDEFSKIIGISRSVLYKNINYITDIATTELVRFVKLNEGTILFKQNRYTIEQVNYMVGFSDPKYFRNCFKCVYGKTPSEYIKGLNYIPRSSNWSFTGITVFLCSSTILRISPMIFGFSFAMSYLSEGSVSKL